MDTSKILPTVSHWADIIKNLLMKLSEFISNYVSVSANNIYLFIVIALSAWVAYKLVGLMFSTMEGRWVYWAGATAGIFLLLKFIGL